MPKTKLFEKHGVSAGAETNNNMIIIGDKHPIIVSIDRKDRNPLVLKLNNDGLSIIEGRYITTEFSINEFNLCNAILDKIFSGVSFAESEHDNDNTNVGQKMGMSEGTANYLIETSGCSNEYVYEDGYIHSLYLTRLALIERIKNYNDKVSSGDVIKINEELIELIRGMPEKETKCLINNDIHFQLKKAYKHKVNGIDDKFGGVVPVYSCDRKKVSGILKHLQNRINKNDSNVFDTILKTAVDRGYKSLKCDGDDFMLIEKNGVVFKVKVAEDGTIVISSEKDGTSLSMKSYHMINQMLDVLEGLC